jgi:hypothetical protein
MSASRPWIALVDGVLDELGVSVEYRDRAIADIEALAEGGHLEHVPLEWREHEGRCS